MNTEKSPCMSVDVRSQLEDIAAWRAQLEDIAAAVAGRYPSWPLAGTIVQHVTGLNCELMRLASNVKINDRVFMEDARTRYARERALQNMREAEQAEARIREIIENTRIKNYGKY